MIMPNPMGADLIAAERQRQITAEGWTPDHDDAHDLGELAEAAACYATQQRAMERREIRGSTRTPTRTVPVPKAWPWDAEWWKPTPENRVRELVKAGALIAAEIDRLQRNGG